MKVLPMNLNIRQKRQFVLARKKIMGGLTVAAAAIVGVLLQLPSRAYGLPTIRINAGGGQYTDRQGRVWLADKYYKGGVVNSTLHAIAGTDDDALYQTERWNDTTAGTDYAVWVPKGSYQVRLHFAEIYPLVARPGGRVFNVAIEGKTVLSNFDIYSQAGANTALVKSFGVQVKDDRLTIHLSNGTANNAQIAAVEIIGQNPYNMRVNTGGGAFTDSSGNEWRADQNYVGGTTNSTTATIANTVDDALYQTERWNGAATPMQYNFTVPKGVYKVRLHFAEIYPWNARPGGRVFDVNIEDATVLSKFDIYNEAKAVNTAMVKEFTTTVTDGQLNISFIKGVANNPTVAGIEVLQQVSSDAWPEHFETAPAPKVDMLVMGDSYAAGNGAQIVGQPNGYFFKSADDPRLDSQIRQISAIPPSMDCFRHHDVWGEYGFRKLRTIYGNTGSFVNAACSGDVTENIIGTTQNPAQLNGIDADHRNDIDLIALTIGGNDMNFVDLIANCFVIQSGPLCDAKAKNAEAMMAPTPSRYSVIQWKTVAVLNKLKLEYPHAKIVLVGYPLFWEDRTLTLLCPTCAGGKVVPGQRLEAGLNVFNAQQKQLIDDLNVTEPGRYAYLPIHQADNQGLYDGHGLHGTKQPAWINDWQAAQPGGTPPPFESWFHPTAAGYAAMGDSLANLPLVRQLFN